MDHAAALTLGTPASWSLQPPMKAPLFCRVIAVALLAGVAGCNPRTEDIADTAAEGDSADVPAGSTVLVAIANPAVNSPHVTGVPGEQDTAREGINIDPEPGGADVTVDGLAVAEVPVLGTTSITSNGGAFVRNAFCGPTVVPSTDATLLDSYGVAPLETPLPGACDL